MKHYLKQAVIGVSGLMFAFGVVACDVEKTEEGELPSVNVDVDGEVKVPKYDVDAPDIKVGTETKEIEVPTVDVIPADEDTNDE